MEEEFEDLVLLDEEEFEAELEQLAYLGGLDSLSFNELANKYQISDAARAEYANSFGYEVQEFVDDGNYVLDTQDIYSFPENLSTEDPFGVFNNLGSTVLRNLPGILNQVGIRASELGRDSEDDEDFIYRGPISQTSDGTIQMQGPMHTTPVLLDQEVGGGGAPRRPTSTTVDGSAGTSGSIYNTEGSGGGMRPIRTPAGIIYVPEGLNPLQLLTQGLITREIYKQQTGEDAPDITQTNQIAEPVELEQETGYPLRRTTDTVVPGDPAPGDTEVIDTITNIQQPVSGTDISEVSDLSGGGLRKDMNEEEEIIDDGIDPGNGIDPGDGTEPGNGGNGGEGFDYEKFFQMLSTIPAFQSGASFEAGEVPGIYPTAIQSLPQASAFIQSILELDRPVSEQQAELKTDIYKDIIGDVREAQSPLMQSLARRSEMQGAEAERLMGPMSFIKSRDATQAGYGQAVAGGRGLGNIREMLAGRQRAEQKNVDLQLASNLLGQQRATAGLMADIESGIYGRMAPDIGVDAGSILGIAGTDIQNILGEKSAREYSDAIREGAKREQQAQMLETGISLIPKVSLPQFTIPGTGITIGG